MALTQAGHSPLLASVSPPVGTVRVGEADYDDQVTSSCQVLQHALAPRLRCLCFINGRWQAHWGPGGTPLTRMQAHLFSLPPLSPPTPHTPWLQ